MNFGSCMKIKWNNENHVNNGNVNKKWNKAPASLEPLPSRFMKIFKQLIFKKTGAGIRTQALKVQGALKEN